MILVLHLPSNFSSLLLSVGELEGWNKSEEGWQKREPMEQPKVRLHKSNLRKGLPWLIVCPVLLSVAMITSMTKINLGEKSLFGSHVHHRSSITESETMEGLCLLPCFTWLAQLAFLNKSGSHAQIGQVPHVTKSLTKKMSHKFAYWPI